MLGCGRRIPVLIVDTSHMTGGERATRVHPGTNVLRPHYITTRAFATKKFTALVGSFPAGTAWSGFEPIRASSYNDG